MTSGSAAPEIRNPAAGERDDPSLVSTFYVNGALFALDTALVEEVVRPRRTTRVAHSPACVVGIMNLRGKIVTVLDLARMLQLGGSSMTEESRLYIVPDGDGFAGLLVDRAADVIELDSSSLEPPPASVGPAESRRLRGIARTPGGLVTVLDAAAVLGGDSV